MHIAITAPEKYDLQDLVCAELALRFEANPVAELRLEPPDAEDAELRLEIGARRHLVEIQVKGSAQRVKLGGIAECLAHFPWRSAEGSLFERLLRGDRIVVLVMSGRCDDAASRHLVANDWEIERESGRSFKRREAKALMEEFRIAKLKPAQQTKLHRARRARCQEIAGTIAIDTVRSVLNRLFVLESRTSAVIYDSCAAHLRSRYRIPPDHTADVLGEVVCSLKEAKKAQVDALPAVQEILRRRGTPPLRPDHYVERGTEREWIAELSRDGTLLLTGSPRCGKSYAARRIADEFQRLGYEVRQGDEADAAHRYLAEGGESHRLYLLDDPLGGLRLVPDAGVVVDRIRKTISGLSPNRKLIVVQNRHLLTEGMRKAGVEDCALEKRA